MHMKNNSSSVYKKSFLQGVSFVAGMSISSVIIIGIAFAVTTKTIDDANNMTSGAVLTQQLWEAVTSNVIGNKNNISTNTSEINDVKTKVVTSVTTTSYNALSSDEIITVDNASGSTINLITAGAGNLGKELTIKNIGASGVGTIATNGSETIDGNANKLLELSGAITTLVSDGSNWISTMNYVPKAEKVYFYVGKSSNQTGIGSSSWTKVTWDNEFADSNNNFSSNAFTPTVAGKYLISASLAFSSFDTVFNRYVSIGIYKNGSLLHESDLINNRGTTAEGTSIVSIIEMNGSTDYVEIYAWQNATSGSKDVISNLRWTKFQGIQID